VAPRVLTARCSCRAGTLLAAAKRIYGAVLISGMLIILLSQRFARPGRDSL